MRLTSTPAARVTGKECFSELSDLHTPLLAVPPCRKCGAPSLGGRIVDVEPIGFGGPVWTLDFYCGEHGERIFPVMSVALFPAYSIVHDDGSGRLKVQRLTRDQMIARVRGSAR